MNRKITPIVVCLLFTFSVVNSAFGMQQMLIMDLNRNHTQQGYYVGKINDKLDDMTMTAIKEQPKMCMVKEQSKMCLVKKHERMNNLTCTAVDKVLKDREQSMENDEY